jgi:hypothetical protein
MPKIVSAFLLLLGTLTGILSAASSDVRINEIMASNKNGIRDEDGEASDWIEVYNEGATPVDLNGWHLSDKIASLADWTFPTLSIPAKSYLVVWASGKNRTNNTTSLHTSFKVSKGGGFVGLTLPDGVTLVSSITYPEQYPDVSYGCAPLEPAQIGFCAVATPGTTNSAVGAGFGPEVQFSVSSTTFRNPITLSLSSTDPNASIHYIVATNSGMAGTTSLPDSTSPKYVGPIQITATTLVRARAFPSQTNYFPGPTRGESYIRIVDYVAGFSSSLPIVVLHNFGAGDVPDLTGQYAAMQVFEPVNGRSSMTNPPTLVSRTFIHRHGRSTRWNPKPNLRVETQDASGGNNNVSLAGLPEENDWIFYGTDIFDKSALHNPLTHELFREMGHYAVRTRYAEVYIKRSSGIAGPVVAADYVGLYVIEEQIKIGKNRVKIDQLWPENTNAPSVTGGYLLSNDGAKLDDLGNPIPQLNAAGVSLNYLDPDYQSVTVQPAQQRFISNYFRAFSTALNSAYWTNPVTGYSIYMDTPSWIDCHLHQVFVFNVDMFRLSAYLYKPRNGRIVQGPLWDIDRSFGTGGDSGDNRAFNPLIWHADDGSSGFNTVWYDRLFRDPDFFQKWIDRYQQLRQTVYSWTNLTTQIDYFSSQVRDAARRDASRWIGSGASDTSPRSGRVTGNGFTYAFPIPGIYQGEVDFVKTWFANRLQFMDTNLLAAPVLSVNGGIVGVGQTLGLTASTREAGSLIYFTLNGTDPRLPGGGISPNASRINEVGDIIITNNATVFARNFNPSHHNLTGPGNPPLSSPWSGPTFAAFKVAPVLKIIGLLADNRIHLTVTGVPLANCYVEVSTNLQNWSELTNSASSNGQFEFTDGPADSARFYRAWQ